MDDTTFKENRELIKKRLSDKQRMPFEGLIDRNIRNGLSDELREAKPMEDTKKILQLNRKLLHRPQPSDIANDDELPTDLKKADSEYYKLYEYRDANSKEPTESKITGIIKPESEINQPVIDNPLDWKFGQRSSAKELEIRGIIPEQFADVVHGNKSLDDAKKEWQEYKHSSSDKIKNKIDLKFRPSRQDLQDRGIVPDWENPNILQENKARNTKSLSMKLKQRMDPHEADQRAIINKQQLFSNRDYEEHAKDKKQATKKLKLKMSQSLNQRPDEDEIVFRGIVPKEYLDDDPHIAKSKIKQQRISVKQQMNKAFGNRPTPVEVQKLYNFDSFDINEQSEEEYERFDSEKENDMNINKWQREIVELKAEHKRKQSKWKRQQEMYENEIMAYKQQMQINDRDDMDNDIEVIASEYETKGGGMTDDGSESVNNLKRRIQVLEQNENKLQREINDHIQSKYQLIISTSAEIDALRHKIKMYTKGNWKSLISNTNDKQ